MKKLNVLFILCLLGIVSCDFSSKQEELPDMQDALLWKISGNELSEPSYLFGSFNGIPSSFLDSVAGLKTALKSVMQVATGVDESHISKTKPMSTDSSYYDSLMPVDTTYRMLYNSNDYAFVDSALKSQLIKYSINYYQLRPIIIAREYVTSVKLLQEPLEGNNSLDLAIMNEAKKASLKLIGLESMKENVDYKSMSLDCVSEYGGSLNDQAQALLFLIKAQPIFKNVKLRLDSTYRQQTPGELYLPINDGVIEISKVLSEFPDFGMKQACRDSAIKQLNNFLGFKTDQKNDLWMKKILYAIKKQPTLISVGALHLIGENGLINQLRQYGYTVEPVLSDGDHD